MALGTLGVRGPRHFSVLALRRMLMQETKDVL